MFYFDKDEVEVQTEPHGFCDGHAPVKVKIGEDALSMDGKEAQMMQLKAFC